MPAGRNGRTGAGMGVVGGGGGAGLTTPAISERLRERRDSLLW